MKVKGFLDKGGHRRAVRGVTLLEMVAVMGIVGILMAIAIPSYNYVTTANRIAGEINGLLGDVQFARSEAIKQGQKVSVCVSDLTGTTCVAGNSWQNGWIVFSDLDGDGQVNGNDNILRVQGPFPGGDTFISAPDLATAKLTESVTFNRAGFAENMPAAELITLHAQNANSSSTRCLSLTLIGLMTVLNANESANGTTCL